MSAPTEITRCEVCGASTLAPVMNLGALPLPDDLVPVGDKRVCEKYSTEILFCNECKTAYQRWAVPNKEVFPAEYHYRSANTKDVLSGMKSLVNAVEKHGLVHGLKVLDIGCNDGSLLDAFERRGAICYGIEPTDAAQEAAAKGHCVDQAYLDISEAESYVFRHGHPDLITFVNVFAHITGLPDVLKCLKIICGPKTRIVIENHYLGSVLSKKQFDTFYHEHPRTYSYTSFAVIARSMGMHVEWVEFPERYGGNIRVFLYPGEALANINFLMPETYYNYQLIRLADQVAVWRTNKRAELMQEITHDMDGHAPPSMTPIPAAGFPGRAAVLIGVLGFDERHISAIYEHPRSKKIGHYCPGTRIPILSDADFPWDGYIGPVLNLAWHIADEIEQNWDAKGFKGRWIQAIDPTDFA